MSYETYLPAWYQTLPYGFRLIKRGKHGAERVETFFLPISPSNVTILTHYATNVLATLYGTVEEHSEQRYFDIEISGTTGITPLYPNLPEERHDFTTFRDHFKADGGILDKVPSGVFTKTVNQIHAIQNKWEELTSPHENETGVNVRYTGYAAFHRLYKFFLKYKKDTSGEETDAPRRPGDHPLYFLNYKDNNKYKCAIQRFVLKRSADDPMLYNYSITLRAYEISSIPEDDTTRWEIVDRLQALGLSGVENSDRPPISDIKKNLATVKGIAGAMLGGISTIGR